VIAAPVGAAAGDGGVLSNWFSNTERLSCRTLGVCLIRTCSLLLGVLVECFTAPVYYDLRVNFRQKSLGCYVIEVHI